MSFKEIYKDIEFKNRVLNKIPNIWNNYDVILGNKIYVDDIKLTKILKYGKTSLIRNPKAIFKKRRNIKFHFDMFHGNGVIDKAIDVLNVNDKKDFKDFVESEKSYNHGNMFICKSKKIMTKYYETVFEWLNECEKVFGFNNESYGLKRIYGFLIERFQSYWFQKYTKPLVWPIILHDINKSELL